MKEELKIRLTLEVVGTYPKVIEVPYDWRLYNLMERYFNSIKEVYNASTIEELALASMKRRLNQGDHIE